LSDEYEDEDDDDNLESKGSTNINVGCDDPISIAILSSPLPLTNPIFI
jgi:hypothetical protein